ncbi:ATP-binding cassette domain-containing protein [Chryseobacterium sp. c4a]|uniref:ABC transporter ATP-binding protein n=1 Tax=Chryseobacterium sp. c4a TaxID=1573582 RepID=UPI0013570EEE|nr:ABC transporter ATP-binding protein [Chryseobacterium sp. c4a]
MKTFQGYIEEVTDQISSGNYDHALKRIIDFTLDTEKIIFYKKTNAFLNWYDSHQYSEDVPGKLNQLFSEITAELKQKEPADRNVLTTMNNWEKKYSSAFTLGPLNLEIRAGEMIGLVGENGNGKTTLLRSLCGELKETKGELYFLFPYKDPYDLRSKLIYIPQRTPSWRGSLLQNLLFVAASYRYSPAESVEITELIIARLGLRKFREYAWKDLSSGYKMRFELARMLLRKPKILLIDEPLANLDIIAQQTVLEDLRQIADSPFRPLAVVLSSQQLYEVEKNSSQIIFLKNGKQQDLNREDAKFLIIEFETDENITDLKRKFSQLPLQSLEQNGSTFIAVFDKEMKREDFIQSCLGQAISIVYFRDISKSSRAFFLK